MPANDAASCEGVHKTYATSAGRVEALRGVDATFAAGAVTAVVGASGSGKSTLLRLLGALDFADAGRVSVARTELGSLPGPALRRMRRTRVAYVFQRPSDNFVASLTLGEHLALAERRAEHPRDGAELLAAVGLSGREEHVPRRLSGGEQQRAAFALAVARGVPLVVADEPTAELDEESAAAVLRIVRLLAERGTALVLATHDPDVRALADDVVELDHGTVAAASVRRPAPDPAARGQRPRRGRGSRRRRGQGPPARSRTRRRAARRRHRAPGGPADRAARALRLGQDDAPERARGLGAPGRRDGRVRIRARRRSRRAAVDGSRRRAAAPRARRGAHGARERRLSAAARGSTTPRESTSSSTRSRSRISPTASRPRRRSDSSSGSRSPAPSSRARASCSRTSRRATRTPARRRSSSARSTRRRRTEPRASSPPTASSSPPCSTGRSRSQTGSSRASERRGGSRGSPGRSRGRATRR